MTITPPKEESSPPGNTVEDLSRGYHEYDCSHLAWSFMKQKSPPSSPVLSNAPTRFSSPAVPATSGATKKDAKDVEVLPEMNLPAALGLAVF